MRDLVDVRPYSYPSTVTEAKGDLASFMGWESRLVNRIWEEEIRGRTLSEGTGVTP